MLRSKKEIGQLGTGDKRALSCSGACWAHASFSLVPERSTEAAPGRGRGVQSSRLFPPSRDSRDLKNLPSTVQGCLVTFWQVRQLGTPAPVTCAGSARDARRHVRALGSRQSRPPSAELVPECPLPSSYNQTVFQ